jgi:hypothetical protein
MLSINGLMILQTAFNTPPTPSQEGIKKGRSGLLNGFIDC